MRYPLLRFDGSVKSDPAIDLWWATRPLGLAEIGREWFEKIRRCGSQVRELMHDGFPTACVEDAPFAYVNVFKAHVNVGFFHGASLRDPKGLLEGNGKYMRHVKVKPGTPLDGPALEALILAAYEDIRERLGAER